MDMEMVVNVKFIDGSGQIGVNPAQTSVGDFIKRLNEMFSIDHSYRVVIRGKIVDQDHLETKMGKYLDCEEAFERIAALVKINNK